MLGSKSKDGPKTGEKKSSLSFSMRNFSVGVQKRTVTSDVMLLLATDGLSHCASGLKKVAGVRRTEDITVEMVNNLTDEQLVAAGLKVSAAPALKWHLSGWN